MIIEFYKRSFKVSKNEETSTRLEGTFPIKRTARFRRKNLVGNFSTTCHKNQILFKMKARILRTFMLVPSCELPVGHDPATRPLLFTPQRTSPQGKFPLGSSLVMSNNTKNNIPTLPSANLY